MKTIRLPLPSDCLLDGRVHPSIAERLERIRQLPVASVANFLGVEPTRDGFDLVWQTLDAKPLAAIDFGSMKLSLRQDLEDQLTQAVAAMHAHGVVHGAIDAQSVLLDAANKIHLTRVSPLLYEDPEIDLAAVRALGATLGLAPSTQPSDLGASLNGIRRRRQFFAGLTALAGAVIFAGLLWYSLGQ